MSVLMAIRARLAGERPAPEDDASAFAPLPPGDPFVDVVADSLDELPDELVLALLSVPVIISDGGSAAGAYGLYQGAGMAHPHIASRIVIFRDTLTRDFGDDPALLRDEIRRTVRHELGHHLGYGERGVAALGL